MKNPDRAAQHYHSRQASEINEQFCLEGKGVKESVETVLEHHDSQIEYIKNFLKRVETVFKVNEQISEELKIRKDQLFEY